MPHTMQLQLMCSLFSHFIFIKHKNKVTNSAALQSMRNKNACPSFTESIKISVNISELLFRMPFFIQIILFNSSLILPEKDSLLFIYLEFPQCQSTPLFRKRQSHTSLYVPLVSPLPPGKPGNPFPLSATRLRLLCRTVPFL